GGACVDDELDRHDGERAVARDEDGEVVSEPAALDARELEGADRPRRGRHITADHGHGRPPFRRGRYQSAARFSGRRYRVAKPRTSAVVTPRIFPSSVLMRSGSSNSCVYIERRSARSSTRWSSISRRASRRLTARSISRSEE